METQINRKDANRLLIVSVILAILLTSLAWWLLTKPAKPILVNGSFDAVKVTDMKPIPGTNQIPNIGKVVKGQNLSKEDLAEIEKFKTLYNLSQKELDSLIVQYNALDSMKNATNDKYYQDLYEKCKPVEFTHLFKKDSLGLGLSAKVSGISNGAPQRLKLDWDIKLPPPKETAFALWGGLEAGTTTTLTKFSAKANLDFQIGESTMIKSSFDTDKRVWLGVSKSIFDIKR